MLVPAVKGADTELMGNLFLEVTRDGFEQVGLVDPELAIYVSGVLKDFVKVENFYWQGASGGPVRYIVDMEHESRRGDSAHARVWQKHIGDFALFVVGMFPESLARPRRSLGCDYYIAYGRHAYKPVSIIEQRKPIAALFSKLADKFELCVRGLNVERDYFADDFYQYLIRQIFW